MTFDHDYGRSLPDGNARELLDAQCRAWPACDAAPRPAFQNRSSRYVETYLDADFCVNPPGASAGRRGIVDALVAGCVPVLFHHEPDEGTVWPWNQRDMWPWQWPWQRAASLEVTMDDLKTRGLRRILDDVPDDQLALMRRVIRENVKSLFWPLEGRSKPEDSPTGLDLAMHHLFHVIATAEAARDDPTSTYAEKCTARGLRGPLEPDTAHAFDGRFRAPPV